MSEMNETTSHEKLINANWAAGLIYAVVLVMVASPFLPILFGVSGNAGVELFFIVLAFEGIAVFILGFLVIALITFMPPKGVRGAWHIGALILACLAAVAGYNITAVAKFF